eukprot:7804834-Pyramimonas_sp.AAC.1
MRQSRAGGLVEYPMALMSMRTPVRSHCVSCRSSGSRHGLGREEVGAVRLPRRPPGDRQTPHHSSRWCERCQ